MQTGRLLGAAGSTYVTHELWATMTLMEVLAELGAPDVLPTLTHESGWVPCRVDLLEVRGGEGGGALSRAHADLLAGGGRACWRWGGRVGGGVRGWDWAWGGIQAWSAHPG